MHNKAVNRSRDQTLFLKIKGSRQDSVTAAIRKGDEIYSRKGDSTLTQIAELQRRRDKYFSSYDRGSVTKEETLISFVQLLSEAPDDTSALSLCAGIPDWFRAALHESLTEMAETDYYFRTFRFGAKPEEVHWDALQRQQVLLRLAPRILTMLE